MKLSRLSALNQVTGNSTWFKKEFQIPVRIVNGLTTILAGSVVSTRCQTKIVISFIKATFCTHAFAVADLFASNELEICGYRIHSNFSSF